MMSTGKSCAMALRAVRLVEIARFMKLGGIGVAASCSILFAVLVPPTASAHFSVESFAGTAENQDGSLDARAGSHPYAFSTYSVFSGKEAVGKKELIVPEQELRDAHAELPPGLFGNVTAVDRCTAAQLATMDNVNLTTSYGQSCPNSAAIGVITITSGLNKGVPNTFTSPLYNMVPPPGYPAQFGFSVAGVPVVLTAHIRNDGSYGLTVDSINTTQAIEILRVKVTVWGVPYDPSHDEERGHCVEEAVLKPEVHAACPVSGLPEAFMTMPTRCESQLPYKMVADSWEESGSYLPSGEPDLTGPFWSISGGSTPVLVGCNQVPFAPGTAADSTTNQTGSPTGFDFDLNVNDEGLLSPDGTAESQLKKAVVSLPEGFTINPSAGAGLQSCSLAEYEAEALKSAASEGCPESSKLGNVEVETPLLEGIIDGSVYLAKQEENPFNSLIAIYVVARDSERGVFFKVAGKVVPNAVTGQLVTTFEGLPQLPFSHFRFSFHQGQTSPLASPDLCGSYTTGDTLYPWSNPEVGLEESSVFQITQGINGAPCPSGSEPPFSPGVIAGTSSDNAGSYTPLYLRITRNDGEQEITGFSSVLPPGLVGNLSGVPFCSEADIASAKTKTGAQEEAEPSCPAASEIGHTLVGAGVGSVLAYAPGRLYLAGPFEGAAYSIVAITSAKVGPFDLGTVIVHLPLVINPITAVVSIPAGPADQIPHIIKGIVVHVRDIRVYVDRPDFTVNPTNCSPMSYAATVIGSGANYADPQDANPVTVSDHFQVTNCAALKFTPKFTVSTNGKTSRTDGASLKVKLTRPAGPESEQANFAKVKVDLPEQLPSRLSTLQHACVAATFDKNPALCPTGSIVGHARVITPILPVPLEGPAYFVSHAGEEFPNLIFVLQGYGTTVDVISDTFIKNGITSATLKSIPDVPFDTFELTLPQGPDSALAANTSLCDAKLAMPTAFTAQNNLEIHQSTPIDTTSCPKRKKAATAKHHKKKHRPRGRSRA